MSLDTQDLANLIKPLGEDVADLYKLLLSEDTQLLRRSFIRSFFAYVEGLTYVLKQHTLNYSSQHSLEYTLAEQAMLSEETYSLNNKGEAFAHRKFLPTSENFLFAMHSYLKKIPNVRLDIDIGGVEWQQFSKALQVRHRIVHPKVASELAISDAEKASVMKVSVWFNYVVISKLLDSVDSLQKDINERKTSRAGT